MKTTEEFWARVDKSGDCWEWLGYIDEFGYGRVRWGVGGRVTRAHRLAAFLSGLVDDPKAPKNRKGPGFVLHRCDNRRCCNPEHLFVGSQTDNMNDMYSKSRHPIRRGGANEQAKLSNGQAAYVRALYATDCWKQAEIAELLGVTPTIVSRVIRDTTYCVGK